MRHDFDIVQGIRHRKVWNVKWHTYKLLTISPSSFLFLHLIRYFLKRGIFMNQSHTKSSTTWCTERLRTKGESPSLGSILCNGSIPHSSRLKTPQVRRRRKPWQKENMNLWRQIGNGADSAQWGIDLSKRQPPIQGCYEHERSQSTNLADGTTVLLKTKVSLELTWPTHPNDVVDHAKVITW